MQTLMNPLGRRSDFQRRLDETNQKLKAQKDLIASLEKEKAATIESGEAEAALETDKRLFLAKEELPDLELTRRALQGRLRIFEKNEAQAATIRETVQASWEQIRPLIDLLIAKQAEVAKILEQISPLQHQIASAAPQHMSLVGEELDPPILRLPKEAQFFSTTLLQPLRPWRFVSESEKKAAAAKKAAQERVEQEKRIKVAVEHAPECDECDQKMKLRTDVSDDGETGGRGSGTWAYECEECGVVGSAYVPETDLRDPNITTRPGRNARKRTQSRGEFG
jgi:hypothetical protein